MDESKGKEIHVAHTDKDIDICIDMFYEEWLDETPCIITLRQKSRGDTTLEVERNGQLIGCISGYEIVKVVITQMITEALEDTLEHAPK